MQFQMKKLACLVLVSLAAVAGNAAADQIGVWQPLDVEQKRAFYAKANIPFPEEQLRDDDARQKARLKELREKLAPAPSAVNHRGVHYFEGRILKVIPPVNPAAPPTSEDRWSKIVFSAYGAQGAQQSRRPAVISTMGLYFDLAQLKIDTLDDFTRLFSDRHLTSGQSFGSSAHRQALFAALDPDGSLGLPSRGAVAEADREGALMIYAGEAERGFDFQQRFLKIQLDPTDPLHHLTGFAGQRPAVIPLPNDILEEYARSLRYPAYEAGFSETAKMALQILYTLAVASPDLASPLQQDRARRLALIGVSTVVLLDMALEAHSADVVTRGARLQPFMPLEEEEVRRAALKVLADGPVAPFPPAPHQSRLVRSLLAIMARGGAEAATAGTVLYRHLSPDPGEEGSIEVLYEPDREAYRRDLRGEISQVTVDHEAGAALAWVGWGPKAEAEEFVDHLFARATVPASPEYEPQRGRAVAVLRMAADPEKSTRPDRRRQAAAAAARLNLLLQELRKNHEAGFRSTGGSAFLELWDGSR